MTKAIKRIIISAFSLVLLVSSFVVFAQPETQTQPAVTQNFEECSEKYENLLGRDYSLYTPQTKGYSAENVKSGSYSLKRNGQNHLIENVVITGSENTLIIGQKYTVSFFVKLTKYSHTNGAVKVACGDSKEFAYDIMGEFSSVMPIASLTDGRWHKVEYTFRALTTNFVVQTPGYCQMYFDDFTFTEQDRSAPLSTPTEPENDYIPKKAESQEEYKIIDPSLTDETNNYILLIIAAVVVLLGAAVILVVFLKRKKNNKANAKAKQEE